MDAELLTQPGAGGALPGCLVCKSPGNRSGKCDRTCQRCSGTIASVGEDMRRAKPSTHRGRDGRWGSLCGERSGSFLTTCPKSPSDNSTPGVSPKEVKVHVRTKTPVSTRKSVTHHCQRVGKDNPSFHQLMNREIKYGLSPQRTVTGPYKGEEAAHLLPIDGPQNHTRSQKTSCDTWFHLHKSRGWWHRPGDIKPPNRILYVGDLYGA